MNATATTKSKYGNTDNNDTLLRRITKMSREQLSFRLEELLQADLSFNSSERRNLYIEMGMIVIKLRDWGIDNSCHINLNSYFQNAKNIFFHLQIFFIVSIFLFWKKLKWILSYMLGLITTFGYISYLVLHTESWLPTTTLSQFLRYAFRGFTISLTRTMLRESSVSSSDQTCMATAV